MSLRQEVEHAEITHGHWNYAANGKTVTLRLKNGSTRIITFAEAEAEGIEYKKPEDGNEVRDIPTDDVKAEVVSEPTETVEETEGVTHAHVEAEDVTEPKTETPEVSEKVEPKTKEELKKALDELGVEYTSSAKVAELKELYEEAGKEKEEV